MLYVNSDDPDERVIPTEDYSLIRTFSVRGHILQHPLILLADNRGLDQPVQMSAYCIRACAVRILH